jgi:hypothetical protein
MARKKTFRGGKHISEFEPIEFELNDQKFACKPAIQGATLLEFVAKADSDSGGAAAAALYGFFEDTMEEAEYARFMEYLNAPEYIIEMETIGEIASWLVEQYTARPTQPSAPSATGPSSAGSTSTEQPYSADSPSGDWRPPTYSTSSM